LTLAFFDKILSQAREYFFYHMLSLAMVAQIGVIGLALLLAHKTTGAIRAWLCRLQAQCPEFQETCADMPFLKVIDPLFAVIFLWIASRTAHHFHWPREVLYTALILLVARALVRFCTTQMQNRSWARIKASD
jgi:MFS-type transporter involved in bile tolerance (Atg22 family)